MIELILTIAILGVIVWAVTQLPMPEPFRTAIYVLAVLLLVMILLNFLGVVAGHPVWRTF